MSSFGRSRARACFVTTLVTLIAPFSRLLAQWEARNAGTTASLRGLSLVSRTVVWASGARGTVVHTEDGGATWRVDTIPGAATFDVRSVHARSARVAHAAATAGRIWRTLDGGRSWSLRYQATDTSVFLDAIVFSDDRHGVALGDPMGGRFVLLVTDDGGENWKEAPLNARPVATDGEAAFAASGSSMVLLGARVLIGSGGTAARVHVLERNGAAWHAAQSTLQAGSGSNGIFALAFLDARDGIAVGGDYRQPDSTRATAAFTTDGGESWQPASGMPHGFRSGAAAARLGGRSLALSVGTNGTDVSIDGGRTWRAVDGTNLNAVALSADGMAFAVGPEGRVMRLDAHRLVP